MLKKSLVFLALLCVLLRPADAVSQAEAGVYRSEAPRETLEVAMGLNLLLTDQVRINGKRVGYFLIDTGSNRTVLSPAVAKELGLEPLGGFEIQGESRGQAHRLDALSLGPIVLEGHVVGSIDLAHIQVFAQPLAGILGADVLGQVPITIDFRGQSLTFHDPKRFAPPKDAWAGEMVAVNYFREEGKPATESPAFSPAVRGEINGQQVLLMLDSGKNRGLTISPSLAQDQKDRLGEAPSTTFDTISFDTGSVQFLRFDIEQMALLGKTYGVFHSAIAQLKATRQVERDFDAIVGNQLLRDVRLTLDFKNLRIWAQPASIDRARLGQLAKQGTLDQPNIAGVSPLFDAVRFDDVALTEALLEAGADPAYRDQKGNTTLIAAVHGESGDCLERLLAHKDCPGVNVRADNGATPLMLAANLGHVKHGQLLIEHGADVRFKSQRSETLMHAAAHSGDRAVVGWVLEQLPADWVDQPLSNGVTPLMIAADKGHAQAMRLLIEAGAKPTARATVQEAMGSQAVIHFAATKGHVDAMKLLLEQGVSQDEASDTGLTPLMLSAALGEPGPIKLLLDHAARIDVVDKHQMMALHYAVKYGRTQAAAMLIDRGASVSAEGDKGVRPLDLAALNGDEDTARLLVKAGADPAAAGRHGKSARELATSRGHDRLAQLLGQWSEPAP